MGDLGSIPGLGRSSGEGKGYQLQYFGMENSMDCTVHGVAKSRTWLINFHFHHELASLDYSSNPQNSTPHCCVIINLHTRKLRIQCLRHWWQQEEWNGCCFTSLDDLHLNPISTMLNQTVFWVILCQNGHCNRISEMLWGLWQWVEKNRPLMGILQMPIKPPTGQCWSFPLYHAASAWVQSPNSTLLLKNHEWKNQI